MLPRHIENPDPEIYLSEDFTTLDVETTNIEKGDPRNESNTLLLSCWRRGKDTKGIRALWGNEFDLGRVSEGDFRSSFLVAHNAKFELGWLRRSGEDLTQIVVWDTMIAEYVIHGNVQVPLDLDSVCKRYGLGGKANAVSTLIKSGICPSEIPKSWLERYCKQDVHVTHELFKRQLEKVLELGLLPVVYTRCLLTPVLADIEFNGMCLDAERVEDERRRYAREYLDISQKLDQLTGGINMRSPKQVSEFLYDTLGFAELKDRKGNPIRSEGGNRSTSKETIAKLRPRNKRQRDFLELRQRQAIANAYLTKSLDFFSGVCEERDCIFDANFNQCITKTHRLSSSGKTIKFDKYPKSKSVQFQNLPRIFKRLFKARKDGWKVGETDAAQLEYRVAVFLGQDEAGLRDIRERVDSHAFTASVIFGKEWEEVAHDLGNKTRKELRTASKAHTFKPLFGGESGTEAEQRYYQAFKDKHQGITAAQERWKQSVLRDKKLTTITGLVFYWPDTRMTHTGYITNTTNICNYPVQSFATADIIPIAVVYSWHRMKAEQLQSFMVNTVHDSAITEVHPDEVKKYKEISELSFTSDVYRYLDTVYGIDFNVPLEAEVEIYDHWSED